MSYASTDINYIEFDDKPPLEFSLPYTTYGSINDYYIASYRSFYRDSNGSYSSMLYDYGTTVAPPTDETGGECSSFYYFQ